MNVFIALGVATVIACRWFGIEHGIGIGAALYLLMPYMQVSR